MYFFIHHAQPQAMIFSAYAPLRAARIQRKDAESLGFQACEEGDVHTKHRQSMPCATSSPQTLLEAVGDSTAIQIVDGKFHRDLVARKDLDVMHAHFA